ncbi:two pore domain potassium channel family protein [Candidatus Saccharibacteria bacterium]|nr:two pore domain potassium channel family protein [Candidatus Saccharibacteria bacterium]
MTARSTKPSRTTLALLKFASHTKLTLSLYIADYIICTIGYMLLEKATLGDALWWCTVTWFTVGYGDTIPLTGYGRLFGIFAIVSSHLLIILVTANFVAKLTQYKSDLRALELLRPPEDQAD